jgi:hypothetical protein
MTASASLTYCYRPRPGRGAAEVNRWLISVAICSTLLALALAATEETRHWFVIPILACGILCCADAIGLFQSGPRRLMDPVAVIGAFGVYFFFLAPLLHVARDYWFTSRLYLPTQSPGDWRNWLGWMGILNWAGLAIYRLAHRWMAARKPRSQPWHKLNTQSMRDYGVLFLLLTFALQAYLFWQFGGVSGFVDAFRRTTTGENSFQGMGWAMCIAESFPILLVIVFAALGQRYLRGATTAELGGLLCIVFGLLVLFGGLRGSRGNVVYAMAYAMGIVHLTVRQLSWRFLTAAAVLLSLFMYVFAFYKVNPETLGRVLESPRDAAEVGEQTGRTAETVLLGDLDRADIQAYMLFRIIEGGNSIEYALGRTYIDGLAAYVPYGLFGYRPPGKLKYGTTLLFGDDAYNPGFFVSTKIYGLAGEAMLNFGIYAIPIVFAGLGILAGWLRRHWMEMRPDDARLFLMPISSIVCVVILSCDLDNVLYVLLRHALLPATLLWLSSRRFGLRRRVASLPYVDASRVAAGGQLEGV